MARRRPPTVHGLAIVDKPAGVTSHDVVGMLRRRLGERRIGHAGTLDPSATGVLVLGVGSVTRLLRFVGDGRKRYTGEVVLGIETDTLRRRRRRRSPPTTCAASPSTTPAASSPTTSSATSSRCRRWCRRSRSAAAACTTSPARGSRSSGQPRPVTVERFDVDAGPEPGVLAIEVTCTAGTYVRTLAADLGRLLGGGAHLRDLRRTRRRDRSRSTRPRRPTSAPCCRRPPPCGAWRRRSSTTTIAALVADGRRCRGAGRRRAVGDARRRGSLLAVYEPFRDGPAKPAVVLG